MTHRTLRDSLGLLLALSVAPAGRVMAQDSAPPAEAPKPAQDTARAAPPARPPRRRSDTIYRDQFQSRSFASAYDVIEALKNNWLVRRPSLNVSRSAQAVAEQDTSRSGSGQASSIMQPPDPMPDRSAPGMDGGIQVYLDGARMGDVEQLRTIPASLIQYIRHLDANEAQARFGIGHNAGAIIVSTQPETGRP